MIYCDYEIWTNNGWERVGNLTEFSKIMVFNLKTKMASFKEVGKISTSIEEGKVFMNDNYDFIFCDKNIFLNERYIPFHFGEENQNKVLTNRMCVWIVKDVKSLDKKLKFYTFELEPHLFVYVKNVIPIYISWDRLDNGLSISAKIKKDKKQCLHKKN